MIKKNGLFFFEIFKFQNDLAQAVSTRRWGDMTADNPDQRRFNQQKFLKTLGLELKKLVLMEQTHSRQVKIVGAPDQGKEIDQVDGLVTVNKGLILGVKTADCLPLVAYDNTNQILGVAHLGWRGILRGLVPKLIKTMKKLGSEPKKIMVALGPHIGHCCYSVSQERVDKFQKKFPHCQGMISKKGNTYYLDLQRPIIFQLQEAGISRPKIQANNLCTSCHHDDFFSFRKEGQSFGEFLTVAAIKEE